MRHGTSREYLKGTRRHGKYRLPIHKFLASKIGHDWDEVYSELSNEFGKRTYARYKFFRNLKYHIDTDCWIGSVTGTIYNSLDQRVNGFFVHPQTRTLQCVYEEFDAVRYDPKPITRIAIDERHALERIEGLWFFTEFKKNIYHSPHTAYLPAIHERLASKPYVITYKRQLNGRELRMHGLRNDTLTINRK